VVWREIVHPRGRVLALYGALRRDDRAALAGNFRVRLVNRRSDAGGDREHDAPSRRLAIRQTPSRRKSSFISTLKGIFP